MGRLNPLSWADRWADLGPDLQRILCQAYDSAALTPDLCRACELQAIKKNHKLNLW